MASKSLLSNARYNRLDVNRLEVQNLKVQSLKVQNLNESQNESSKEPSYLFSLDIKNGKLEDNQLSFNNNDYQLLSFTDRPFRYSSGNEDGSKAEQELNFLFNQDNSSNSFTEDPPNAVLTTDDGQEVYELLRLLINNNQIYMNLKPLRNELPNYEGKMSLFIDNKKIYDNNSKLIITGSTIYTGYENLQDEFGLTIEKTQSGVFATVYWTYNNANITFKNLNIPANITINIMNKSGSVDLIGNYDNIKGSLSVYNYSAQGYNNNRVYPTSR